MTEPQIRRRVNASISVKGVVTWDVTVETTRELDDDFEWESLRSDMLAEHDMLWSAMEQRYGHTQPEGETK